MLEPVNNSKVPQGGYWVYVDEDTKTRLQHPYYEELSRMARKHRQANGLVVHVGWDEIFDQNICQNAASGVCKERGQTNMAHKAIEALKALGSWASAGFPVTPEETFKMRMAICEGCPQFSGKRGLLAVHCGKCGCSKLKLSLATEHCPLSYW